MFSDHSKPFLPRWLVSEPGLCSAVCGPGSAQRNVSCVRPEEGQEVAVDHVLCQQQVKPSDLVPCVVDVCPVGWDRERKVHHRAFFKSLFKVSLVKVTYGNLIIAIVLVILIIVRFSSSTPSLHDEDWFIRTYSEYYFFSTEYGYVVINPPTMHH